MTRSRRLLCTAVAVSAALAACGGDSGAPEARNRKTASPAFTSFSPAPQATVALPKCNPPKEVPFPEWVPDDLPLPENTYAYQNLKPTGGYKRSLFVLVNTNTTELTKMVLREWPKSGYTLGRGDAEPGEVEDDFHKPPAVGAFKANDVYCDPGYAVMYLIYAPEGPQGEFILPSPTSKGTPLKN